MSNSGLHIIGHNLCPYVQRVVIVLQEKSIPYKRTDIDLDNKPEWLTPLSPTGKVPILVVDENKVLFESNVICEFVDEISAGSLHPEDIFEKAKHRAWIEFGTEILNCIARIIYKDKTKNEFNATISEMIDRFRIVEEIIEGEHYFSNSRFHIIDAVYATIFRYFNVIDPLANTDTLLNFRKINKWKKVLSDRQSVRFAVPHDYNGKLEAFIAKRDSYLSDLVKTKLGESP